MKKTGIILIFIVLINISVMYANTPIVIKTTPTNRDVIESKALKKIKIFFTHPLNVKTINIFTVIFQKFNGEKLFGKVDYNSANSCIVFTPALQLKKNSKYVLYIKTGIRSLEGENLLKEFKLVFSTKGEKKYSPASLVGDMYPLSNEKNVNTDIKIFIRFKDEIDQSSLNLYTFRVLDDSGNIYGDIKYNSSEGFIAVFEPIPNLDENTRYKVILDKSIRFTSGKLLDSDFSWVFTTAKDSSYSAVKRTSDKKLFTDYKWNDKKTSAESFVFGNGVAVSKKSNAKVINDIGMPKKKTVIMDNLKKIGKIKPRSIADSLINPGDLLEITVYNKKGLKEVSEKVRVYLDGQLTFPFAGTIPAAGKSVLAIKKELEKVLSTYYIEPRVDVWFQKKSAKLENIRVTILGAVDKKGSMKIARDTRLVDILAQSGLRKESDLKRIQIKRSGKVIVVDCSSIEGKVEDKYSDTVLHDSDIIIVPVSKTKNQYIYISGYVNTPGRYKIENDMSLLDAIYKANGFLGEGSNYDNNSYKNYNSTTNYNSVSHKGKSYYGIKVFRKKGDETETINVNTKDIFEGNNYEQDITIQAGDFIRVTEEKLNKTNYVYLFGEAQLQGRYQFISGMTIVDLLSHSGGIQKEAKWVNVIRKNKKRKRDKVIFVDLRELLHKGKINRDVVLEPMDIVFVSKVRYKNVFWRIGDYLERSVFPGIEKVVSLDDLLHKLKNLKVLR